MSLPPEVIIMLQREREGRSIHMAPRPIPRRLSYPQIRKPEIHGGHIGIYAIYYTSQLLHVCNIHSCVS